MKTQKEFLKGCEHDGSFVPVNEVKRLMSEYADHVLSECIPEPLSYDSIESTEYVEGFTHDINIIKTNKRCK